MAPAAIGGASQGDKMAANKVLDNPAYEVAANEVQAEVMNNPLFQGSGADVMNNPLFQGNGSECHATEVGYNALFQGSGAELVGISNEVMTNPLFTGS